jgi:hypothetical protein
MLLPSFGHSGPEQAVEVLAHIVRRRKHIDSEWFYRAWCPCPDYTGPPGGQYERRRASEGAGALLEGRNRP